MVAPNIVNVATITGISTFIAGINTGGDGVAVTKNPAGVTTIVSNAASSGKVLKINSLVAAGVGNTTGVTVEITTKQLQLVQQIQFQLHQRLQFLHSPLLLLLVKRTQYT